MAQNKLDKAHGQKRDIRGKLTDIGKTETKPKIESQMGKRHRTGEKPSGDAAKRKKTKHTHGGYQEGVR